MSSTTRDLFGIHPVYYDRTSGAVARSLHAFEYRTPDVRTITEYLAFGECWRDDATFWSNIGRVPPGGTLNFPGVDSTPRFNEIELVDRHPRDLVRATWQELVDSVERAVGAAGEIVVSLSGGLDSAAFAVAAVELFGKQRVRGVTSGCESDFDDPEPRMARSTARHLGIEWDFVCADSTDLMVDWPSTPIWPTDPLSGAKRRWDELMPGADGVVLWGLGGDSLQRGDYAHYRRRLGQGMTSVLWDVWNAFAHGHRPGFGWSRWRQPAPVFDRPAWMREDAPGFGELAQLHATVIRGWRRGIDELLAPVWSYCFEAEAPENTGLPHRYVYPFFDERLARFWASVPTIPWSIDKELLRVVLRGRVPEAVRLRPKSPVAGEPRVTVTVEAAATLAASIESGAGDRWFRASDVLPHLRPGVHDWSRIEPFVRCAAVARWMNEFG